MHHSDLFAITALLAGSTMPAQAKPQPRRRDRGIELIAIIKLVKSALLILAGLGVLTLLTPSAHSAAREWLLDLSSTRVQELVGRGLKLLSAPARLTGIAVASLVYGALFAVEGVGLWLEKRWAEYLTVIATGSLIPLELYELARKLTPIRAAALVFNIAAVVYLIVRLRKSSDTPSVSGERTQGKQLGTLRAKGRA